MRLPNLGYILGAALRYQLPRQTYGSGIVADAIIASWRDLDERDRNNILRDIRGALDRDQAGGECDKTAWRQVLAFADGFPTTPTHAPGCASRYIHGREPCDCDPTPPEVVNHRATCRSRDRSMMEPDWPDRKCDCTPTPPSR